MARVGSRERPAVVRVQTEERAIEIHDLCQAHGWEFIMGLEPDKPEDIADVMKLLHPERFTVRRQFVAGRNAPCPCGSGRKYKKCCLGSSGGST